MHISQNIVNKCQVHFLKEAHIVPYVYISQNAFQSLFMSIAQYESVGDLRAELSRKKENMET